MAGKATIKKDLSIDGRIKAEKRKLQRQFKNLDNRTKKTVESLLDNAAFMIVTLQDLQESIKYNGPISKYQNGANQWGTKKSPEVEIYNTMIKNHMQLMRQLTELLPEGEEEDGFMQFVMRRDN